MLNINVNRKDLINAIKDFKKVSVKSATNYPILKNNILITSIDNSISLTYSDNELTLIKNINGITIENGSLLIPLKNIDKILKKLTSQNVTIKNEDQKTVIQSKNNAFTFSVPQAINYPTFNILENGFNISFNQLKNLFSNVLYAKSNRDSRPILTSVNTIITTNNITAITCDSYRLSKKELPINTEDNYTCNIAGNLLEKALKMDIENDLIFSNSENFIQLKGKNTTIQIKILDGDYPNIDRLLPTTTNTTITLDKKELLQSIELGQLLSIETKNNAICLDYNEKTTISVEQDHHNNFNSNIKNIHSNGENINVLFNPAYMIETLKNITSDNVILSFTSDVRPFTIENENDNSIIHLLTPIRKNFN